jgi:xylulokinase
VFVDADGHALAPAVTWQDSRATRQAAELDADVSAAEKASWWGAPLPIGASHVLARMVWMAKHKPDLYAATRHVLTPKDYCLRALAGVAVADPMSNFFVVGQDLTYVEPLIARVPGARERLPPLKFFTEVVGEIELGSSGKRAPVVAGTMDAWSGLFGAGVHKAGQGVYISGTSEILAVASAERVGAPGVVTFPSVGGLVVHAGPTQCGGDSLRWWGDTISRDVAGVLELASRADRSGRPLLFLPHLEGERAPLWDAELRGAFIGLDGRSSGPDYALAVMEGVALSARMLLASLDAAAGEMVPRLFYAGGGARSDLWGHIRADCLGRPLDRVLYPDVGCLGAAIMAAVGVGAYDSLANAVSAMTRIGSHFEPDRNMKARYDAMYETYVLATQALRPLGIIEIGR